MKKYIFYLYFLFYYLFLMWYGSFLNIGNLEVDYLSKNYPITFVENFSLYFGHSNFFLRLPSIILSIFSIFLYYQISKKYLKKEKDVFLSTIVFSLMPGFIIATLLFNKSIYLIFLVLIFIYSFFYYRLFSYIFLAIFTIADKSFISLYMGLIFYSIYKKDSKFLIYSVILLMLNANYFDYKIGGHPNGYFIDILGVYFAIFSPFVFIYFLYSLVKIWKKPTLLWFISTWGLLLSFILSFRQRIKIDDFAPYVIVAVVFMLQVFLKDYRIRLKIFRPFYRNLFIFLFSTAIIFDIFVLMSPYILNIKMVSQFRYSYQVSKFLKAHSINKIQCNSKLFCRKLYFYGVKEGREFEVYWNEKDKKVSISHNQKKLYTFYVSKLNKKSKK